MVAAVGYNQAMPSFAIVATVDEGAAGDVAFRLRLAPPFDLPLDGIDGHQVFLGREHAAFVFWGSDPEAALVLASGRADALDRMAHAITGMSAPRKLDGAFQWAHARPDERRPDHAVAVISRGVDMRSDPDNAPGRGLVDALGGRLQRLRIFVGEGAGLIVIERTREEAATGSFLPLATLELAEPVVPLRPLEVLSQTYWFEAGTPLSARPPDGILDTSPASATS